MSSKRAFIYPKLPHNGPEVSPKSSKIAVVYKKRLQSDQKVLLLGQLLAPLECSGLS